MKITVRTIVEGLQVWVNGEQLRIQESRIIRNHSEDFSWGYAGSGPAQTALGVCLHLFGPYIAPEVYQRFKFDHVQNWYRWEDTDHSVNVEKFYFDYIDGQVMDNALSRFSQNVYDRLFEAVKSDGAATALIAESSVINSQRTQTRIIMDGYSKSINDVSDALNLSYINVDGKWNIIGSMPITSYMHQVMATAKKCLQV